MTSIGALLGLTLAIGVLVLTQRLAATRRPSLRDRIAPYTGVGSVTSPPTAMALLLRLMRPERWVARRMPRGSVPEALIAAFAGLLLGAVLGSLAAVRGSSVVAVPILGVIGAILGVLILDRWRIRARRTRAARMARELPTVSELLAFAVAAGESPVPALERVASMTVGDLSAECRTTIGAVRAGSPLDVALRDLADRCASADVERFVDGVIVAIERGTPLADVLRAQAADTRAAHRRALIETAGRKDVLMLVPVVFLILPTVVGIALYPGLQSLNLIVQ